MLHDVRGHAFVPLDRGPLRLVSLVPSTTETLFALDRGEDLVGYTRFCVHPEKQVHREKWIGGTKNPKIRKIIDLEPDLILANREENRQQDIEALEAAGIPVWVAEPRTVGAAVVELRALGRLIGRTEQGEDLARRIEGVWRAARAAAVQPLLTVAYVIWRDPWMVAGQETFIADLLAQGGAQTPFRGRYPEVTLDDLHGVDRLLLASEPFPFKEEHCRELLDAGLHRDQLRLVDGERLSWHGVRLLEGLRYLHEALCSTTAGVVKTVNHPDQPAPRRLKE